MIAQTQADNKIREIDLGAIRTDGGTQVRAELDQQTFLEYGRQMLDGVEFPPIDVFFDGSTFWLADGFHRFFGRRETAQTTIKAVVHDGTVRDAILFACKANAAHGRRRTNADKKNAVATLLKDPKWRRWSDRKIAEACQVTHPFVGEVRRELVTVTSSKDDQERIGKDGKARKPRRDNPPAPAPAAEADFTDRLQKWCKVQSDNVDLQPAEMAAVIEKVADEIDGQHADVQPVATDVDLGYVRLRDSQIEDRRSLCKWWDLQAQFVVMLDAASMTPAEIADYLGIDENNDVWPILQPQPQIRGQEELTGKDHGPFRNVDASTFAGYVSRQIHAWLDRAYEGAARRAAYEGYGHVCESLLHQQKKHRQSWSKLPNQWESDWEDITTIAMIFGLVISDARRAVGIEPPRNVWIYDVVLPIWQFGQKKKDPVDADAGDDEAEG